MIRPFALPLLTLGLVAATCSSLTAQTVPRTRLSAAEVQQRIAAAGTGVADLRNTDLSHLDLHGLKLETADLRGASLDSTDLRGASLFSADLTDATLRYADLTDANLDGSTLRRADASHAVMLRTSLFAVIAEQGNFTGADLRKTRIIGYFRGATLAGADLREANIGADPGNQSMGVMRTSFESAKLGGANFGGANLYKADFNHAEAGDASFAGANLSTTVLRGTDFSGADFTGADLTFADFDGAILTNARGIAGAKGIDTAKNRDKATPWVRFRTVLRAAARAARRLHAEARRHDAARRPPPRSRRATSPT